MKPSPPAMRKRTPAARWGDPRELIGAAVFLSSKPPTLLTDICCLSMAVVGCRLTSGNTMARAAILALTRGIELCH